MLLSVTSDVGTQLRAWFMQVHRPWLGVGGRLEAASHDESTVGQLWATVLVGLYEPAFTGLGETWASWLENAE